MTKTFKDKLVTAVISAVTTLIVGLILLSFTNYGESQKEFINKLDKKVDYTVYDAKCKDINQKIDKKLDREVFEMSQKNIDLFIANQILIQNDIKELLKNK